MANDNASSIHGLRILMVEDEMLLAMSLEDGLRRLGCQVVTAGRVAKAMRLMETEAVDGALLDVNVAGERIYPVAAELDRRGIPYAFMTGYSNEMLDADYSSRPVLQKPFQMEEMARLIAATFLP